MISSDGALIRAVIRALGALAVEPPPGTLSLNAFLVRAPDGTATAVDQRLVDDVRLLGPVLRRQGRRVLHLPQIHTWPSRGTAVLPVAAEAVGVALEELDARWPLGPGDDDLASGELPITRFVYAGRPEPESRSDALAELVWMLRDSTGRVNRASVAQLAALTSHGRIDGVFTRDRQRLAAILGLA
jgi:hypothetical protein